MATTTVLISARSVRSEEDKRSAEIVRAHGGRLANLFKDALAALFDSSSDAVLAAIAMQRAATRGPGDADLPRIGIHVGDVSDAQAFDDRQTLRAPASLARRLCDAAAPGQVVVSDLVRLLIDGKADIKVEEMEPIASDRSQPAVVMWLLQWTTLPIGEPIRVIVAEDSVLVRAGLVRLLAEEGFDVVAEVGDREELLAAARLHHPDLVVTDVRMPPTQTDEGISAAAALRADDPHIAVLVLSQHVAPAAAALLLSNNPTAVGYLLKERVSHLDDFIDACRKVAAGRVVIDPLVTDQLLRNSGRDDAIARLTDRERAVLDLMAQGRSNAAIAREMHFAGKTLETHVRSIFTKLDMPENSDDHRRVAAVVRWLHASQDHG